jgi:myo-inositol-1(or 4)-monophosphatase
MTPNLSDLLDLAQQAGKILSDNYTARPGFGRHLQVTFKGEIDLVTEVDHLSEAYLIGEINKRFPGHSIISEEVGFQPGVGSGQWLIDPLDGTINYAHGYPAFVVSIAYAEAGKVLLGVVNDPIHAECFSAERGQGAFLNHEPIKVSTNTDLGKSLISTGYAYDIRTNPDNNLTNLTRMSLQAQSIRHSGSAALDMCYVATGRLDGYWDIRLSSWDVAAAGLIAEEAGAKMTNVRGEIDYLLSPVSALTANPVLHNQILDVLNHSA